MPGSHPPQEASPVGESALPAGTDVVTWGPRQIAMSRLMRLRNQLASERGVVAIEFALITPVLLLILFGIIDFARALNYLNDSNQIAAQGARFAAVNLNPGGSGQSLQAYLSGLGDTPELRNGSNQVTQPISTCIDLPPNPGSVPANSSGRVGDPVRVVVTSQFKLLPIVGIGTMTLKGKAVMRIERAPTATVWTPDASCNP